MAETDRTRGVRLRRLRLTGATGTDRSYDVSFLDQQGGSWRPLSVIAGPSQTGKTSVIDFVRYCLGDAEHPQHPEILAHVRASLLETELAADVITLERAASGPPSSFASVWKAPLGALNSVSELRVSTDPPSDPEGLSQLVLAACGLDNVVLPEAPTKQESRSQILSVRDLFRVMWLPNDRLDSKNLIFEHANYMVRQKLVQTIDVMFEVHDGAGSDLAARLKLASDAAREAEHVARSLRDVVQAEHPLGQLALETDHDQARREAERLAALLGRLDRDQTSRQHVLTNMRHDLEQAQARARAAAVRVRNRESLMDRLAALRGQYADDMKKLTFLKEAERLFNPLQVSVCPACLSTLDDSPTALDGRCSLCGHEVLTDGAGLTLGSAADMIESPPQTELLAAESVGAAADHTIAVLEAELKATTRRLSDLSDYWNRLDDDLKVLKAAQDEADRAVNEAATALDRAADVPAPYLAGRDDLSRRRANALLRAHTADAGLRLWARVQAAEDNAQRLAGLAARLRAERKEATTRPARTAVIARLSRRFGEILSDVGYPKLSEPYLDKSLMPHVRGLPYSSASSGGLVLISLAWYVAIWEVAYEQQALAPGLLIIDSPQKNLGHAAHPDDPDFADARLVENFYQHVKRWLIQDGHGAQLVVVDNSPPVSVADDVVVRYTRNRATPPYGLIDDATD